MALHEVWLPLPLPRAMVPAATHVRSTVIISSLRGLRACAKYDAYLAALDDPDREIIRSITAGLWLPIDLGIRHYLACDTLDMGSPDMARVGFESGRYINQAVLGVLLRLSRDAGVTPWSALAQTNRLVARLWQGSAAEVVKLGPKEALVEWVGQPCGQSPYFSVAFASFVEGIITLFCQRAYVRYVARASTETTLTYRLSWV